MLRSLLFIYLFAVSGYSITGFTWKWNIKLTGDTATVSKWKANNDSVLNWSTRIADTLNRKVVHFGSGSLTHDSTLQFINIDTIRNSPNIDTIFGLKKLTGFTKIDSIYGVPLIGKGRFAFDTVSSSQQSATLGVYDTVGIRAIGGTIKMDSVYAAKGIKAPLFDGATKGTHTGAVVGTADSAIGAVRAAKLTTARTISGTSFDGGANVTIIPDSAKGAHHLNGGGAFPDTFNCHSLSIGRNGYLSINANAGTGDVNFLVNDQNGYGMFLSNDNCMSFNYGKNLASAFYLNYAGYQNGTTQYRDLHICDGKAVEKISVIGATGFVGIGTRTPQIGFTLKTDMIDSGNGLFTGTVTANGGFIGNVTGNTSGSSGSCTGNAATATTATNLTGGSVNSTSIYNGNDTLTGSAWTSFTTTVVGFTVNTGRAIEYKRIGKMAFIHVNMTGTSNAVYITFTLPWPIHNIMTCTGKVTDNGVESATPGLIYSSSDDENLINVLKDCSQASFTNSGTKQIWADFTCIIE
jgi:hypothetical protein